MWIRPDPKDPAGRKIVLRTDAKYEDRDTPVIQHYGNRLLAALEGCGGEKEGA